MNDPKSAVAVFGGGCFWCTEAVFDELRGVKSVVSGYAGGSTKIPPTKKFAAGVQVMPKSSKSTSIQLKSPSRISLRFFRDPRPDDP